MAGYDMFQCHRNYNEECKWWSRDESDEFTDDEIVQNIQPSGFFWAKEEGRENNNQNQSAGVFMYDGIYVNIKTPDDLTGIKVNDIVKYQNRYWRVKSISWEKARIQRSQFASANNCSHYWHLNLSS